jgi:hypothetical protein
MFRATYGSSDFIRTHNDLPAQNLGFGINQITTHRTTCTPSESDGNPLYTNHSGHYYDYHHPNVYRGQPFGGIVIRTRPLAPSGITTTSRLYFAERVRGAGGDESHHDAPGATCQSTWAITAMSQGLALPAAATTVRRRSGVSRPSPDPRGVDFFP